MLKSVHTYVHVHVCKTAHGPKPDGHEVAHGCGNPSCCAPKHLRWATPHDNLMDKRVHGTMPIGERHCHAKLTDAQFAEIMALKGVATARELATRYAVSDRTISAYWAGRLRASH